MNPLLKSSGTVPFHGIRGEHIVPAVREAVRVARAKTEGIKRRGKPTYASTLRILDNALERLERVVSLASHLNNVSRDDTVRDAYAEAQPLWVEFYGELGRDADLLRVAEAVLEHDPAMSAVERRHATKMRDDLRRNGAHLPSTQRERLQALQLEMAELSRSFENNLLDSTNAFKLVLREESDLAGLPEWFVDQAKVDAESAGEVGWVVTLHQPSYLPFMKHSERRDLREQLYRARVSLAAHEPHNNLPIVQRILDIRQEVASILGFSTWADYVLDDSMAKDGDAARAFVEELERKTQPHWERDRSRLIQLAREYGWDPIEGWDINYLIEQDRRRTCDIDHEQLRPYFELTAVLNGLFDLTHDLFDVKVERVGLPVWHPDVQAFKLHRDGQDLAYLYTDWFPRPEKRSGAWKAAIRTGGPAEDGSWEPHIAVVCGNFTRPDANGQVLLTHEEVETLFHEFGHALHHALSNVSVRALGGTKVGRDWVEVPSQLMQNWTWERDALARFALHVETQEPMPLELVERLRASRTHMGAYYQMRQLGFGAVDLALHNAPPEPTAEATLARAQEAESRFQVRPEFANDPFIASFAHLFSGGYSARYYSYKWAEMLEADLFSRFLGEGLFSASLGSAYEELILSAGNSQNPMDLFRQFMGREPNPDALIERNLGSLSGV